MRVSYEEQLKKLEAKRAALQQKLAEQAAKNVVLNGDEPQLHTAVAAVREAASTMKLPEKNILDGLAKALMGPVIVTFRKPRGGAGKAKKTTRTRTAKK